MEFCDHTNGCSSLDTKAYRKTKADILRHFCDAHAVANGFVVGEKPKEADYKADPFSIRNTYSSKPKQAVVKPPKPKPLPLQVLDKKTLQVVEEHANLAAFCAARQCRRESLYAPINRRYCYHGQYVRYATKEPFVPGKFVRQGKRAKGRNQLSATANVYPKGLDEE
jgi:hypothetical protein